MKTIMSVFLALAMGATAYAGAPKYNLKSEVILGSYKWVKSLGGTYSPEEGSESRVDEHGH